MSPLFEFITINAQGKPQVEERKELQSELEAKNYAFELFKKLKKFVFWSIVPVILIILVRFVRFVR